MQRPQEHNADSRELARQGQVWRMLDGFRRRDDLGAATKLAYISLLLEVGPDGGQVTVQASALAAEFGCESHNSAKKWIDNLKAAGLIELITNDNGRLLLWIYTPDQAAAPRVQTPNPQLDLLPEESEQEEATGLAAQPVAVVAMGPPPHLSAPKGAAPHHGHGEARAKIINHSNHRTEETMITLAPAAPHLHNAKGANGRQLPPQYGQPPAPTSPGDPHQHRPADGGALAGAISQVLGSLPTFNRQRQAYDDLKADILDWAADPNFDPAVAGKVAELVVYKGLKIGLVHDVRDRFFKRLRDTSKAVGNRGGYLCGSLRKLAASQGFDWPDHAAPPESPPRRSSGGAPR